MVLQHLGCEESPEKSFAFIALQHDDVILSSIEDRWKKKLDEFNL